MLDYKYLKNKISATKAVSIQSVLVGLGHFPKYRTSGGRKIWYSSPFTNHIQKTPSFVVDVHSNTWGDFANGATNGKTGGDVLDLLQKLKKWSLTESISYLQGKRFTPVELPQIEVNSEAKEVNIKKVQKLQNKALTDYLKSRLIDVDIAKLYVEEIYYYQKNKHYFALAFKNNSDGYETRNKYKGSKRCVGEKDVTLINQGNDQISIFEGFMDFLSVLTYKQIKQLKTDVLILNSTALLSRVLPTIQTYEKSFTFLDNDHAGQKATNRIYEATPTKTMNYMYTGFKDFNDFLMKQE